ncbi:MAG: ATP synthase F1 subunit gamma [Candidatus Glassbacteria bacterium]|nr:ATP synthase F1 subunit gamma [Candidatus Glassbacteria bacterium]
MAKARDIKKRIGGVSKTRKITHTMEMVATSRMQKWLRVVTSSRPYSENLVEVLRQLSSAPEASGHPLMEKREHPARVAVMLITSNRGLCGAFNSTINRQARELYREYKTQGLEVELYAVGKKALSFLRHQDIETAYGNIEVNETCQSDDTRDIAQMLMDKFLARELDRVEVLYSHYISAGTQEVVTEQLLPISPPRGPEREERETDFIFEPSAAGIVDSLLPMYVQSTVYRMVTENITSEQVARRRAMKQATDNADEMITNLTRSYNRQRQAQITSELTEIVGASEALD